tara:strand:- start:6364 stop:7170 length:807 start_codon:yes stop_codon:yes gene_type:complete
MPKVSVIMSVFNGGAYLEKSINSILNQTFEDFEFIIVNDGSTDRSLEVMKNYNDPRLVIIDQRNKGLTKSLNIAISHSRSQYLARIDADDVALPKRLELQYNYLQKNKGIIVLGTRGRIIYANFEKISPFLNKDEIKRAIRYKNPLIHSSVMIRKKPFSTIGYYNEKYSTSQDFNAWKRLIKLGSIQMLNQVLVERYVLNTSVSRRMPLIQAMNSFKIRREGINFFQNSLIFMYQLITNVISERWLLFFKKILPNVFISRLKKIIHKI